MQSAAAPIFQGLCGAAETVGGMAMQASYYGRNSGGSTTTQTPPPQSAAIKAGWPGNQNY